MTAIFISHSSADNAAAVDMKAWLEAQGHTSLFLDFDPEAGIKGGSGWEQTLYQQLRQCQAVIALLSPNWLASKWCFAELVQARERGKAIFPVKVQPCAARGVFSDIQAIDLTAAPEEGYRRLRIGLLERGLDPQDVFDWDPKRPPYPGLLAFQEADAAIFFGRGEEILKTLETLDALRRQGRAAARFALLLGASGSGKSSLARAGVIPRLKKKPAEWLPAPPFRPQIEPLDELAMALAAAFEAHGRPRYWSLIRTELHAAAGQNPVDGLALLNLARDLAIAARQPETTVLLTLDQAEELFGYTPSEAATRFLRLLRAALEAADRRLMAVATLRSDFLGEFQNHPALQDGEYPYHFRYRAVPVDPMPLRNFPSIIQGPARLAGLQLDDGLVETIVQDTGTRDALPLLAFTLRRLYERYGGDGRLTVDEYESLGRLEGAIREEAQRVIMEADPAPEDLEALHGAFVPTMVRISAEGGYARRRALLDDLPRRALPLLRRFVDARLLVTDRDPQGRETIEVAHEALLRTWPLLGGWLAEDQDKLRLLESIQRSAEEWDQGGRRDDLLIHRNGRLKDAESLLANPRFTMPEAAVERAYLDACSAAQRAREAAEKEEQERRIRDAERIAEEQKKAAEAQRRTVRNTRIWLGVAVALLGIAILAGWQAWREAQRADHQARTATAQKLAAQARVHFAAKPDLASLLSSEASLLDDAVEVKASLLDSLEYDSRLQTFLRGHTAPVQCVTFSRDGEFMATGGDDHTIHLWDARTWQLLGTFPEGHKGSVWSLAFSPDSALLASGTTDQTVRLWNVATREPVVQPLTGHTGWVRSVVFHPDGKMLLSSSATESDENETLQWDLSSQPPSKKAIGGREHMAGNLALSPNGRLLAIGRGQGRISLWDLQTHSLRGKQLKTAGVFVQSLAFNSDSKTLAASDDWGIGLWDLSGTAPKPQELADNVDFIQAVAISPDGKLLAGGGNDTVVHLWDVTTNRQLPRPLVGHRGYVTSLAFHPDGTTLVSGSEDGTLIKWSLIPRSSVRHLLRNPGRVLSAAFSPDEHWLATGLVTDSAEGTILVWDLTSSALTPTRSIPTGRWVTDLAFAADGNSVIACHDDAHVRLWDVHAEQPRETLLPEVRCDGHSSLTRDGSKVFVLDELTSAGGGSDEDRAITVWEIPSGRTQLHSARLTVIDELAVESIALSPDGKHFVAGMGNGTVLLWDLRTVPPARRELSGHNGPVAAIAFSPDGTLVASGGHDATIRLWNVANGELQRSPMEEGDRIDHLAFDSTGTTLAVLYARFSQGLSALHFWDVKSGMALGSPLKGTGPQTIGNVVAFSPTGRWVFTGGDEDEVVLWDMDLESWRAQACRRANRNFHPTEEWPLYMAGQPYRKTCPELPLPLSIPRVIHDIAEETF